MKKHLFYIAILFNVFNCFCQTGKLLYEVNENGIKLRWNGIHKSQNVGFNVYRKEGTGDWIKLNTNQIRPLRINADIKKALGYKSAAYLQLFGIAENNPIDINAQIWDSTFAKTNAEGFIGVMSLINPEYAVALGETYTDLTAEKTKNYTYKVRIINGADIQSDLVIGDPINAGKKTAVPDASDITATPANAAVKLEWKKEKEWLKNGSVVTYKIYKSENYLGPFEQVNYYGILSATVQSGNKVVNENTESYTVDYLENGKTYYFKVKNVNAFGTESESAVTVSATPKDPATMGPPDGLRVEMAGKVAKISWKTKKSVAVYKGEKQRGGFVQVYPPKGAVLPAKNVWYDQKVTEGREYWYTLRTQDESGNFGPSGDTIHLFYADATAPAAPTNVKAVGKKGLITLTWDANKETDILGYEIERASDKKLVSRFMLTKTPINATIYKDSLKYLSQTTFGYVVYAVDKSYNRSKASAMTTARMPDYEPPAKPLITLLKQTDSGILIQWDLPMDKDILLYRIYRRNKNAVLWEKAGETSKLQFNDKPPAGTLEYAISAVDSSKNESEYSMANTIISADLNDTKPPRNGTAEIKDGNVELSWKKPFGSLAAGWVITRVIGDKRLDIAMLPADTLNFTDPYPVKGKIRYEIRARNGEWQMGIPLIIDAEYKP